MTKLQDSVPQNHVDFNHLWVTFLFGMSPNKNDLPNFQTDFLDGQATKVSKPRLQSPRGGGPGAGKAHPATATSLTPEKGCKPRDTFKYYLIYTCRYCIVWYQLISYAITHPIVLSSSCDTWIVPCFDWSQDLGQDQCCFTVTGFQKPQNPPKYPQNIFKQS